MRMPIFCCESSRAGVAFASSRRGQIDSAEDHRQIGDRQFHSGGPGRGHGPWDRALERPDLKPLVPNHQAVTLTVEDLDAIAATVEKQEEMAREVLAQELPDHPERPSNLLRMSVGLVQRNTRTAAESCGSINRLPSPGRAARPRGSRREVIWGRRPLEPDDAGVGRLDLQLPGGAASTIDTGRKAAPEVVAPRAAVRAMAQALGQMRPGPSPRPGSGASRSRTSSGECRAADRTRRRSPGIVAVVEFGGAPLAPSLSICRRSESKDDSSPRACELRDASYHACQEWFRRALTPDTTSYLEVYGDTLMHVQPARNYWTNRSDCLGTKQVSSRWLQNQDPESTELIQLFL